MAERRYTLQDLFSVIGMAHSVRGREGERSFTNVKPIYEADESSLVWVNAKKNIDISRTLASIVLVDPSVRLPDDLLRTKTFIVVDNPKLAFIRTVEAFFVERPAYGIHPTAYIHPDAVVHPETFIGPFTSIGRSTVGRGTVIHGHCHIYDHVAIGANVVILAGAVIGGDGYGYSRNEKFEFEKFPHVGGVVIEDHVEIGANTCVDRGTLGNTVIREGAKIDNLVHIAHNVVVGRHAAVIAHAMVGGSTELGEYSWTAPSAALMNGITIGAKATVGLGAVVTKNIPDGETWAGIPAQPLKDFIAAQKAMKELRRRSDETP